ncbi:HNH endonuclease [Comamonas sp. C11]|uniref:HNH endonuclease n=1 Tax=Comamonas sp. C11 TaxID=2966554 RepID=UPI002111C6E1|nr:HNH endonuclease signature motif containing protein [Comamonas sp. C11]UUC95559.1 HNH endonuclease [Comamonas sp. C11]
MALSKKQRAELREKFGGRCAYCGSLLGDKWHADHVEPIVRNDWFKRAGFTKELHCPPDHPERDTLANMNPACPPCNIDKHSLTLEGWRELMQRSNEVLMRDVSTFRRAVRYGLVTLNSEPIVFYFEKLAAQQTQGGKHV